MCVAMAIRRMMCRLRERMAPQTAKTALLHRAGFGARRTCAESIQHASDFNRCSYLRSRLCRAIPQHPEYPAALAVYITLGVQRARGRILRWLIVTTTSRSSICAPLQIRKQRERLIPGYGLEISSRGRSSGVRRRTSLGRAVCLPAQVGWPTATRRSKLSLRKRSKGPQPRHFARWSVRARPPTAFPRRCPATWRGPRHAASL